MSRMEIFGAATLYLGDCREILPTLGHFDACVTDPPYGISYDPKRHKHYDGSTNDLTSIQGDEKEQDFGFLFSMSCRKIIWGAENFYSQIPYRGRWICWYKRSHVTNPNSMPSGDFELAWDSRTEGFYKYVNIIHGGAINADSETNGNNGPRFHPTQKPVLLMQWCLNQLPNCTKIIDPYMGSGTTGIACIKERREFCGIEIDEKHFNTACRRIEEASKQDTLF